MAEKIARPKAPASEKGRASDVGDSQAEALGILHPERQVAIGDRIVEVREYGYIEGLKLQSAAKAFLDALYELFPRSAAPPSADDIADVMATHIFTVQWMIGQAITPVRDDDPTGFVGAVAENVKWIGSLNEESGDLLTALWWEVNKRFFTRRLQRRALAASAAERSESPSESSVSTTP